MRRTVACIVVGRAAAGQRSVRRRLLGVCALLACGLWVGCSSGAVKPAGYRVTESIKNEGMGPSYSPRGDGTVFLIVKLDVPASQLVPTEAEFLRQKADSDRRNSSNPSQTERKDFKREHSLSLSPERFTVVLADGRGFKGDLVAASGFPLFAPGLYLQSPDKPHGMVEMQVAFVLESKDANPPFRVQFDRLPPVLVPERRLDE